MKVWPVLLIFLLTLSAVHAASRPANDTKTIIYYYLTNSSAAGENNTRVFDYSGSGNNGTLTITTSSFNATGGYLGLGGIKFGGSGAIDAGNVATYNSADFSIGMSFSPSTQTAGNMRLADRRTGNNGFILTQFGLTYSLFVGNGTNNAQAVTGNVITPNVTGIVRATYNSSSGKAIVYYNGVLNASATLLNYNASNQNLRVCRDGSGTNCFGEMADFIFQNRTVGPLEVWSEYLNYYGNCLNISEDLNLGGSTTFCGASSYLFNDTGANGVLLLRSNNSIIGLNGSTITGNGTTSSSIIRSTSSTGMRIENGTMKNFYDGLFFNSGTQARVNNIISSNNTHSSVEFTTGANNGIVNNLTDTFSDAGVWVISSNDTLINGSSFTNNRYAIRVTGGSRTNVSNTYITGSNGSTPISIYAETGSDTVVLSNDVFDNTSGIALLADNSIVQHTVFRNFAPVTAIISLQNNSNVTINNVTVVNTSAGVTSIISLANSRYVTVANSDLEGPKAILKFIINMVNTTDSNITNNTLRYGQYDVSPSGNATRIIFSGNTFRDGDMGGVLAGNNMTFRNNRIINTSANYDGYDIGLKVSSDYAIIDGNNFSQMTSGGVYLQQSYNSSITNNSFSFVPWANRSQYAAGDYNDVPCAIKVGETYKSFLGGNLEALGPRNWSYISTYDSINITIANNTFDNNTQCFLWVGAGAVTSHDLTNYTYWHFRAPKLIYLDSEVYMNNQYDNLSSYTNGILNDTFQIKYSGRVHFEARMHKTYMYLRNMNSTVNHEAEFFNLTNGLVYYDNGTVPCSNIGACTDVNTTYAYLNYSYTLQNFNISETAREFSPITMSGSGNTRSIQSNLTDTIYNVTVIVNATGVIPSSPRITYANGSSENPAYSYDPVAGRMTATLNSLPSGNSTLTLNPTMPSGSNVSIAAFGPANPPAVLQGYVMPLDSDGGNMTVYWAWFLNGVQHSSGITYNVSVNITANIANFTGPGLNQIWTFSALVFDGVQNGTWQNSTAFSIATGTSFNSGGGGGDPTPAANTTTAVNASPNTTTSVPIPNTPEPGMDNDTLVLIIAGGLLFIAVVAGAILAFM